jgi:hypothetical protein
MAATYPMKNPARKQAVLSLASYVDFHNVVLLSLIAVAPTTPHRYLQLGQAPGSSTYYVLRYVA